MSEAKFDYLIGQTWGTVSSFSTNTHDFDNVLSIWNLHQDNKIIFSLQKISLFTLQNPLGGQAKGATVGQRRSLWCICLDSE